MTRPEVTRYTRPNAPKIPTSVYPMTDRTAQKDEPPEISVVVPLYNEQENVGELYRRLTRVLRALGVPYEIVFVNDGSRDATPALIDGCTRGPERRRRST